MFSLSGLRVAILRNWSLIADQPATGPAAGRSNTAAGDDRAIRLRSAAPGFVALEPRMLFDGAAAFTTDFIAQEAVAEIAIKQNEGGPKLNRAPVVSDDGRQINQNQQIGDGQAIAGDAWNAPDHDPDGDAMCISGVAAGRLDVKPNGRVGDAINGVYGSLVIQADGAYCYTPNASNPIAAGATVTDHFSYTLCDAAGNTALGHIAIAVTGVADKDCAGPVVGNDSRTVEEARAIGNGQAILGTAFGDTADTDACGRQLWVVGVATGSIAAVTEGGVGSSIAGQYGRLLIQNDGGYSYQTDASLCMLRAGESVNDVFSYLVTNDAGQRSVGHISIIVTGVDQAPAANDDARALVAGASTITGQAVRGGIGGDVADSDADCDPLTVVRVGAGSAVPVADATSARGQYGDLTIAADGSYQYQLRPDATLPSGQVVNDSFTYVVRDSSGMTDTATITIRINEGAAAVSNSGSANRAPLPEGDVRQIDQNTTIRDGQAIAGNAFGDQRDSDPDGDPLRVQGAAAGMVMATIDGGIATPLIGQFGVLTIAGDGSYQYVPNDNARALPAGASADDKFSYSVSDGRGGSATCFITIRIQGLNDAPSARPDRNFIDSNAAAAVTGNAVRGGSAQDQADFDADGGDRLTVTSASNAAAAPALGAPISGTFGSLLVNPDGSYQYVLTPGNAAVAGLAAGSSLTDAFTYNIRDEAGATATSSVTITIVGRGDGGTPATGTPAAGTPAAGTPAAGTPAAGTPAAGAPAAGAPAAGAPVTGAPPAAGSATNASAPSGNGAEVQRPFVNPIVPAGITGTVVAPLLNPGLAQLSDVGGKPLPEIRFQAPNDNFSPFAPEKVAGFVEEAKAAESKAAGSEKPSPTPAAVAADSRKQAAEIDCVEQPKNKVIAKPKPKAAVVSPFAAQVGEGKRTFSEQVQQSRKSFQAPAKVRPALARDC